LSEAQLSTEANANLIDSKSRDLLLNQMLKVHFQMSKKKIGGKFGGVQNVQLTAHVIDKHYLLIFVMCLKRHTKSQISQRMAKMKIYGHRERHSFTSGR